MPTRKDRPTRPPEPPHRAAVGAVGTDQQGPVSAPAAPHMLAPSRPLTPIVGFFAEHDGILGRMSNGHSFAGAGSDLGSRRATRTRPRGRSGHLRRRFGFGTLAAAALIAFPLAASAAPSVQITEANASDPELGTPNQIAQTLLGPDVELDGDATINGSSDPAQYNPRLSAFGRFTDGADDVGIDDGLIFGANMNADYFRTGLGGTVATSVADDDLFNVVNAEGLCTPYTTAATCVHSATSIEFSVRPTSRYIKFEYALAVTEYGTLAPDRPHGTGRCSCSLTGSACLLVAALSRITARLCRKHRHTSRCPPPGSSRRSLMPRRAAPPPRRDSMRASPIQLRRTASRTKPIAAGRFSSSRCPSPASPM